MTNYWRKLYHSSQKQYTAQIYTINYSGKWRPLFFQTRSKKELNNQVSKTTCIQLWSRKIIHFNASPSCHWLNNTCYTQPQRIVAVFPMRFREKSDVIIATSFFQVSSWQGMTWVFTLGQCAFSLFIYYLW